MVLEKISTFLLENWYLKSALVLSIKDNKNKFLNLQVEPI